MSQLSGFSLPCPFQIAEVVLKLAEPDPANAGYNAEAYPVFNIFPAHFKAILAQGRGEDNLACCGMDFTYIDKTLLWSIL